MKFFYSLYVPKFLILALINLIGIDTSNALVLRAYLSQHGLHGEIEFSQKNETFINVRTNLKPTLQYPDQVWKWSIHEFPVDYRDISENRCSDKNLGKELIDLTEELGYLILPGKDHAEYESQNMLTGIEGVWGKSLVLKTAEHDRVICASILSVDMRFEKHAVAKFTSPVAGTIHFRWLYAKEFDELDSYVQTDLYHTKAITEKSESTKHIWKIFVTDIFDSDKGDKDYDCNVLQEVFDPVTSADGISVGDLDKHLGLINVASEAHKNNFKTLFKHEVINVLRSDMEKTKRSLYIVVYDNRYPESFLACAKLRQQEPRSLKALINMHGISGEVGFTQRSPFDPTWANFQIASADKEYESNLRFVSSMLQYNIRELPAKYIRGSAYKQICNTTGNIFNPSGINLNTVPPPGMGTQDQYAIGDVFGKYKDRTEYLNHKYLLPGLANELSGLYWDVFLPLQGRHSVLHRSMVLERREKKNMICGTLLPYQQDTSYQVDMISAQVFFRYPLVGKIIFRQPKDKSWEDTTIIVEELIHADGSNVNNTFEHRWSVNVNPPGKDYYNWTSRCLSAGKVYEPFHLDIDPRHPEQYCMQDLEGLCKLGDLTTRHGTLAVAGSKKNSAKLTRRLYTDSVIALSGKYSIMGKSLVLYDDHGPVARGERMACSVINSLPRRKAVVKEWFGNGDKIGLKGKIEIIQQSEYDAANVEVALEEVDSDVVSYRIHIAPVLQDLEFPCEKTTLLATYNPFKVERARSPAPTKGSVDLYELGDLASKHGMMTGSATFKTHYNDTQLSLFGPYSIIGRSVVLHKKTKSRRWSCSSIERGYSPAEAREIRAIASFHHPDGFAFGYVRLTQLRYNDGSGGDTVMEVNLRYAGARDRNFTRNHNWEIFVNPVGVDATVKVTNTRCVAGGYRWNPYFTQLADPLNRDLYNEECGADNPLRCDVGDLTARLGTINLGGDRQVYVDSNFPLEGAESAVGRSIVIFGPERTTERLACANIGPDKDIIKYFNVMKPPRFVLTLFLDDVRTVMGIPPWFLTVDSRRTRQLHRGSCLQLLLHFSGPDASNLERDFTKLLATGRLDSPSIYIPGYVPTKRKSTTSYRQCGLTDPNEKTKTSFSIFSKRPSSSTSVVVSVTTILFTQTIRLLMQ